VRDAIRDQEGGGQAGGGGASPAGSNDGWGDVKVH
jgi:hypothetical protein